MTMGNPTLRTLTLDDVAEVTRVHLLAFPESALSRLGRVTVARYYAWQFQGPNDLYATGLFDEGEGTLLGYCFGGVFRDSLSGFMRRNLFLIGSRLLLRPWLLSDPMFQDRFATGLFVLRKRKGPSAPAASAQTPRKPYHNILALAVDPAQTKRGLGKQLMADQERRALDHRFQEMRLSVALHNTGAIAFYERLGYRKDIQDPTRGWQGKMVKPLAPAPEP
jgi:ribosomal protein S18 acetylase RimI-like enzyme